MLVGVVPGAPFARAGDVKTIGFIDNRIDPLTGAITFTPEAGFTADPTPISYTVADNDGNVSNAVSVTVIVPPLTTMAPPRFSKL